MVLRFVAYLEVDNQKMFWMVPVILDVARQKQESLPAQELLRFCVGFISKSITCATMQNRCSEYEKVTLRYSRLSAVLNQKLTYGTSAT